MLAREPSENCGVRSKAAFYSGVAAFGKKLLGFLAQYRQVTLYGFPDDLEIDIAVVVNHAIAHTNDLVERDIRKFGARLGSQAGCRFSCDLETTKNGILRLPVLHELLVRLSRDTSSPPVVLGGGLGLTAGGTAAVGVGIVGAAATGGGTAAVFANAQSGGSVSAGLSASGGAMATAGQNAPGVPQQPSNSTAAGAFIGAGIGIVLTNAGTNQALASTTTVFSFDIAFAFGGSIQVASGPQGVNAISITLGPGFGLAFTKIDTATAATGSQ